MSACGQVVSLTATPSPEPSLTPSSPPPTSTQIATGTATPLPSATATVTKTATITRTPTITSTPTITVTPTRDFPDATVLEQANCRYGPGTAYLYSHGLYAGDPVEIHGRNASGTWYWIQPANLDRHCWASEIVMEVTGDPMSVPVVQTRLPHTTFAGPPGNIQTVRNGSQVTITWDEVPLSDDKRRGYLLEATVCQNGGLAWMAVQTDASEYTFTDDTTCSSPSSVLLYTAEKHGYSDPVSVPWP